MERPKESRWWYAALFGVSSLLAGFGQPLWLKVLLHLGVALFMAIQLSFVAGDGFWLFLVGVYLWWDATRYPLRYLTIKPVVRYLCVLGLPYLLMLTLLAFLWR